MKAIEKLNNPGIMLCVASLLGLIMKLAVFGI